LVDRELEPSVAETVFVSIWKRHITVGLTVLALEILIKHTYSLESAICFTQRCAGRTLFVGVRGFECDTIDTFLANLSIGAVN
tara:strand:+ start:126 stop:374 length:249 start_codon:yes stop_codon:yes gene_type:complete